MSEETNKVFKRLSLSQRGHFSNYFTFFPIKKIELSENFVILQVRNRLYKYAWKEIKEAKIIHSRARKSYGRYAGSDINARLFVLVTSDRTFKFDLSSRFPDFNPAKEILNKFRKHLTENTINLKEERRLPHWHRYKYQIWASIVILLIMLHYEVFPLWLITTLFIMILSFSCLASKEKIA